MRQYVIATWAISMFLTCGPYSVAQETVVVQETMIAYDSGDRRDPFIPLIGPDGKVKFSFSTTDITIEGIIFDPKQGSMVLVAGELYKEGESIGNANVISIFKDRVILEQETEQKTMWIRDEVFR